MADGLFIALERINLLHHTGRRQLQRHHTGVVDDERAGKGVKLVQLATALPHHGAEGIGGRQGAVNGNPYRIATVAGIGQRLGDRAGAGAEFEDITFRIARQPARHGRSEHGRTGRDGAGALRVGQPLAQEKRGVGQCRDDSFCHVVYLNLTARLIYPFISLPYNNWLKISVRSRA